MPIIAHRRRWVGLGTLASRLPNGCRATNLQLFDAAHNLSTSRALVLASRKGGFMEISGNTFLVTGGASGLGAATARTIVSAGGNAVLADVNAGEGEALARALGDRAVFARTDVTDEASANGAVRTALERFGALAGVINCAGIVHGEKILGK